MNKPKATEMTNETQIKLFMSSVNFFFRICYKRDRSKDLSGKTIFKFGRLIKIGKTFFNQVYRPCTGTGYYNK